MEPSAIEQYVRMLRWLHRVGRLSVGVEKQMTLEDYMDEIYAFFLNCHHFKDWLKNDTAIPASARGDVEAHINSKRCLRLCADLCNGLKHFSRDREPRSKENPTFRGSAVAIDATGPTASFSVRCNVETDAGPIDAYDLAKQCVDAWNEFLSAHPEIPGVEQGPAF